MKNEVELGDLAEDVITKYRGIVVAMARHLTGCDRVTLQAQGMGTDGKLLESYNFDLTSLVVIRKRVAIPDDQYVIEKKQPDRVELQRKAGGPPTRYQRV